MLHNLILTAFRSLNKNKFFSFLNITGLAIGMSVFLLILLYVQTERSYENFNPDADNIYRVTLTTSVNGEEVFSSAENYPGVGPAFQEELPEVTGFARLYNLGYKNNVIITYEDATPEPIAFKQRKFLYADSSFLPMMGYKLLKGDVNTALAEPNTAVLSEKYASQYFGNEDPIGKMLRMQDDDFANELVRVTGVVKEGDQHSHLKFDVLFSYKTLYTRGEWAPGRYNESWQRKDMYTYIRVQPGTDAVGLQKKFDDIIEKYNPALAERNQKDVLGLQPIKSIHLTSNLSEEAEPNGDAKIVNFLALIGIFVLLIAWINYINLSTAKAMERAREVGVRKVMGAFKFQLVRQFLMESAVINLISIVLALGIVAIALPHFNILSGLSLTLNSLTSTWFLGSLAGLWLMGTALSGFYPAIVLSSFAPVTVLKGKLKNSLSGILLRKALVVLQFTASVALIAGTLIVYRQLDFMMNREIGMDIDQVLVVERPGISSRDRSEFNSSVDVFRNELKKNSAVTAIATSVTIPGKQREYKAVAKRYGASDDEQVTLRFNSMDYEFIDVFKMKIVAGRAFSEEFTNDPDTSAIISESAARLLGFKNNEDAVGQAIAIPGFRWNPIIVGVVNDYHQESLKKPLDPSIFYCTAYSGEFYSMRIQTSDLPGTIEHVRQAWTKAFPGNPMDYFFLDDYFNKQYDNEQKFGRLFSVFAGLAVIVGCLGLFGLSAYTASQRTKEIGVRKVMGSSESGIFVLLSKEYMKLIMLSIVIAVPLVWLAMESWIATFPYQTTISALEFVIAGLSVLIVSLSTVSFQTLKAARNNPVDSLRQE